MKPLVDTVSDRPSGVRVVGTAAQPFSMTVAPALTPPTGILPLTGFVMGAWVVRVHGTTDAGVLAGAVAGVEPDGADGTGAVTVMDRALVATLPPESVTSTVIGATCTVVGVPEITPVAVLSVSPAGRVPLVSAHDE
jgi:hypothetical protein